MSLHCRASRLSVHMLVSRILVSIAKPTHIAAWYDSGQNAPSALRKSAKWLGYWAAASPWKL